MPARQIFENKRRRRGREIGTRTYRCTYRKTIRGSKMKTVGRMPAGRVTRRKISSKLSKRYFARMQESRFRPLCLSLPLPALLNPEERGSEIHPILTPPLFESNSVLDLSFSLSFYRISCSRELKIFFRVCF